jgi:hypothetical protein
MWGDRHAAMPASRGETTAVPRSTGWRGKICDRFSRLRLFAEPFTRERRDADGFLSIFSIC